MRYFIHAALAAVALAFPATVTAQEDKDAGEKKIYAEVESLVQLLFADGEDMKIKAASKLGKIQASYSVPALKEALGDPSMKVRLAVIEALGQIATSSSAKALTAVAKGGGDADLQVAAVEALTRMHIDASYQGCVNVLESSKDAGVKKAALNCLRLWNEPFVPLKKPLPLPKGKQEPEIKMKPAHEAGKGKEEIKGWKKEPKKGKETEAEETPPVMGKLEEIKEPAKFEPPEKEAKPGGIITEYPAEALEAPMISQQDEVEVPTEEAYVALETAKDKIASCMTKYHVQGRDLKLKVLITPGGQLGHAYILKEITMPGEKCIKDVLSGLEFPPFKSSYIIDHEYKLLPVAGPQLLETGLIEEEEIFPSAGASKPSRGEAVFLPFELNNLSPTGQVWTTFSVPHSTGGLLFTVAGEYLVKKVFGIGLELSAGSGNYQDEASGLRSEKPLMGNLALATRLVGSKALPRINLFYGMHLYAYVPTAGKGDYRPWGSYTGKAADPDLLAGIYASQINYYRIERSYPNINSSMLFFLRPDFGFALGNDRVLLQVEMGFDFMIFGNAKYRDLHGIESSNDAVNIVMTHLGVGFYALPIDMLQLSLEVTYIKDLTGNLYDNPEDPSSSERSPGGEFFVIPSTMLRLPLGKGQADLKIGFRVPTGEISANMSNFIWVLGAGYSW